MPKPRDVLNEHWAKFVFGLIMILVMGFQASINEKLATAQDDATSAMTKATTMEQQVAQMTKNVAEIKDSAKEIAKAVAALIKLTAEQARDIKYDVERHKMIDRRLEKLEE